MTLSINCLLIIYIYVSKMVYVSMCMFGMVYVSGMVYDVWNE